MKRRFPFVQKYPLVVLFMLFYILHLLGIFGFTSHFEWGTGRPLLTDDYAGRSALFEETRFLFKTSRRFLGYNPHHLAGYLYTLFPISSMAERVLSLFFFFIPSAEVLKFYVFFGILILPFWMMAAAKVSRLSPSAIAMAGAFSLLFFWKHPNISSVRWGSISYIIACPLAVLSLAFLLRFLKERASRFLCCFWLFGSIALLTHVITLVIVLPALTALVQAFLKKVRGGAFLGSLALFGIVAANSFWILPLLHHRSVFNISLAEAPPPEGFSIVSWYVQKDLSRPLLLLLGLFGIMRWRRTRSDLAFPFAVVVSFLIFIMFFFEQQGTILQQRFTFRHDWFLSLFLSLPASTFLTEKGVQFFELLRRDGKKASPLHPQTFPLLLLYGITLLGILTSDVSRYRLCLQRLFLPEKTFLSSFPLPTSMTPPPLDRLLTWVRTYHGEEGRLLMEDSRHPHHVYWGSHLPAILPLLTGREVVSPPLPQLELHVATIEFLDGKLAGKPIGLLPVESFMEYLDRYNVRWIICFSPQAIRYLERLPKPYLHREDVIGPFVCYKVNRPSNFFLKGSGKVSAQFNRLSLKQVKADGDEVILKYHWVPVCRTVPERPIGREPLEGDPLGFIRIEDPTQEMEIFCE